MPRFRLEDWFWVAVFAVAVIVMIYVTFAPWLTP